MGVVNISTGKGTTFTTNSSSDLTTAVGSVGGTLVVKQKGFKAFDIVPTSVLGSGKFKQNGFGSFKLVPAVNEGTFRDSFETLFNEYNESNVNGYTSADGRITNLDTKITQISDLLDDQIVANNDSLNARIDRVAGDVAEVAADATAIEGVVNALSNNLTTNYLSKAQAYSQDGFIQMASGIKQSTATFVTSEQAGQWYGLSLETDANGTKYISGLDMGAIVNPSQNLNDSYFRIRADRFIVGGDLGDGFQTGEGENIPAFSITQADGDIPRLTFNGRVKLSAIPSAITKYIGEFASVSALDAYLASHLDVILNKGDTYLNTTDNTVYTWSGFNWISTATKAEVRSFVFKRSATKPTTPTGGSYESMHPIETGWSDGFPTTLGSNVAADPVWMSSCTFNNKQNYGLVPAVWSEPEIMADTTYSDTMYNNSVGQPIAPTYSGDLLTVSTADAANGWYNNVALNSPVWMATRSKKYGAWSAWSVYKIKGEDGVDGLDGAAGSDGAAGINASAVKLQGSVSAVSYTAAGENPNPNNIAFVATVQNVSNPYYRFYVNSVAQGAAPTTSNVFSYTCATTYSGSPVSIEVEVRKDSASGPIVARDEVSIASVRPGADTITVVLSNEAHVVPADSSGGNQVYTGSGTTVQVYQGATLLTFVANGAADTPNTYKITATGTNVTAGTASGQTTTTASFGSVSGMTADNAYITFDVRVVNSLGKIINISKIQSLSKSKQGVMGANGANGTNGTNGVRGSLTMFYKTTNTLASVTASNATITAAWTTVAPAGIAPAESDQFVITSTLTALNGGGSELYTYSGSSWVSNTALAVNGNVVVDGTIYASKIAAGTITGDRLDIGTITTSNIADGNITGGKLAGTTITGDKIATGAITADKMTVSSLSAITGNIGTLTSGRIQNTGNTTFIDFNATGVSSFLKVGTNVDIKADGSGYFARSIVSAPNVVASGTKTGLSLSNSFTYYIDTGYTIPVNYYTASTDMFACSATLAHGIAYSGGGNGYMDARVVIGDGFIDVAHGGDPNTIVDSRIYIKVEYTYVYGGGITTTEIDWKLVKL